MYYNTPPDTRSFPILGLHMLRPVSSELVIFPEFEFRTSLGTSIFLLYFSTQMNAINIVIKDPERKCS